MEEEFLDLGFVDQSFLEDVKEVDSETQEENKTTEEEKENKEETKETNKETETKQEETKKEVAENPKNEQHNLRYLSLRSTQTPQGGGADVKEVPLQQKTQAIFYP